jgi:rSAM/selenodomain-associated transferase 2
MATNCRSLTSQDIAVVCAALNEQASVGQAVQSAFAAGAGEVLVVDGGSVDQTIQVAQQHGARVIRSPRGRARQQNIGAAHAQGVVLLFLHADSRLAPACLQQICDCLNRDPHATWGAFRQRIMHDGLAYRCLEWGNAWRVRWRRLPFGDQAIFARRNTFESVGGFPDIPFLEDLRLSLLLRHQVAPCLLDGPLFISARHWQSRGVIRQTFRNWSVQWAHARGAAPEALREGYDQRSSSPHDGVRDESGRRPEELQQ